MEKVTFTIAKIKDVVKIESDRGLNYEYPNMMSIETALAAVIFQTIRKEMDIKDCFGEDYTIEYTLIKKIID